MFGENIMRILYEEKKRVEGVFCDLLCVDQSIFEESAPCWPSMYTLFFFV